METTMTDTKPTFARLTGRKASNSWRAAVPAVVVVVALVALLAYLASSVSSYSQKAAVAQRDADDARQQMATMTKQVGTMQTDLSAARDPGRTTVILQSGDTKPAATKKGAAATPQNPETAWAAATWGESSGGKTWMRINAYGLVKLENGQGFHIWMTPATGEPVNLGALDADANGSAYLLANNLPGLDQGKSLTLSQDDAGAKEPTKVLAKADLPKLQASASSAAPAQAPAQDQNQLPQARSSDSTQQMHQGK
jgi:anti-sigma-K factor RskA